MLGLKFVYFKLLVYKDPGSAGPPIPATVRDEAVRAAAEATVIEVEKRGVAGGRDYLSLLASRSHSRRVRMSPSLTGPFTFL